MARILVFIIIAVLASCNASKEADKKDAPENHIHVLWYEQPAERWMEALPVGNGRFGAMIFGNPQSERIQLNEDSMWPGGPDTENAKGTEQDLKKIRNLIKAGRISQADQEIVDRFSYKGIVKSHQTMGDLFLDFEDRSDIQNYKRSLDLNAALVNVSYSSQGEEFTQSVFASAPDNAIIIKLTTTAEQGMDLSLRLSRPNDQEHPTVEVSNPTDSQIAMKGEVTQFGGRLHSEEAALDHGVRFETLLEAQTDQNGEIIAEDGVLKVQGARELLIKMVANTSFYVENFERANRLQLARIQDKEYETLLERHQTDYSSYFDRLSFELGNESLDSLATDVRLERIKEQEVEDQGLITDLFQFGRYLLISSSRPGTNPANLQGIWNEHIAAPWNADYHLNVNLQMNYWPAGVTGLSELQMPLFDFTDRLIERGRITASRQYGINRGSVAHQASDLWADTYMRAERSYWGSWIHGGGWLAQHYWEHYRFTKDRVFLENRAYPAMKAFAEFYLDWLVWDEDSKKWVSTPETSPENSYIAENGQSGAVSYGSAMGHQIIAEVFDNSLEAAKILKIEDDFVQEVRKKRQDLFPGVVVGVNDRILEWNKPYEEPEKGHRHLSHLYALHPGDDITQANPEAFQAARNSIEYRLKHGGAGTGWSRAWMINFYARLLDGNAANEHLNKFMQISVADNLFDLHPPFQIDGNFGFTAAIAEMLLQSHEDFIRVLPALPDSWKSGTIKGLKARGDIQVDIEWKENRLVQLVLSSNQKQSVRLVYRDKQVDLELPANKKIVLDSQLNPYSNP